MSSETSPLTFRPDHPDLRDDRIDIAQARRALVLRKQRKGKTHAAETVGCTVDTFAEQVVIYLIRAVEARVARPGTPTPEPEPEPRTRTEPKRTRHEPPNYRGSG